jgi:hypothetical protein
MVSGLEGLVVFDLPWLADYVPSTLNVAALAGLTTRQIAMALKAATSSIADDDVRTYIATAGALLDEAGSRRNDLLHARPGTIDGRQRLSRWKAADRRGPHLAFPIDTAWLNDMIDFLSEASYSLNDVRPLHKRPPSG